MLLYVLESSGSSPGRQGFFMSVNASSEMEGSIGGGIMEHKFVELAKSKLKEGEDQDAEIKKQVHDKSAAKNQSGMICSGEQTILLYKLQDPDIGPIEDLINSLEDLKNGTLDLSPDGIKFSDQPPAKDFNFVMRSEDDWEYKEKTGYKNHLFIIGGGHCSLAFSRLMRPMDFYIHVIDERPGLKTMNENEAAHEKYIVKDYSELENLVSSGEDHYVVIMTFGYRSDDIALRSLIDKKFRYLGLLGSKKKIEKMFEDLVSEGVPPEAIQRVHAPVGISIKSQTPEEIAVSIAAEIISIKNALL